MKKNLSNKPDVSISVVHMYLDVKSFGWCWQLEFKLRGHSFIIPSGLMLLKRKGCFRNKYSATVGKKNKANNFLSVSESTFVTGSQ